VRARRIDAGDERAEMAEQQGPKGKVDGVAILYILGGIPAIVAFVVVLFALVRMGLPIPA
jgi:hypothetical protein